MRFRTTLTTILLSPLIQVRVVEHKKTKQVYALKYIDKSKCVKQKAVANIIQERRLLEEVCHAYCFAVYLQIVRRSTILSLSIYDTPFKTTKIAFLFWTLCSEVTFAVGHVI